MLQPHYSLGVHWRTRISYYHHLHTLARFLLTRVCTCVQAHIRAGRPLAWGLAHYHGLLQYVTGYHNVVQSLNYPIDRFPGFGPYIGQPRTPGQPQTTSGEGRTRQGFPRKQVSLPMQGIVWLHPAQGRFVTFDALEHCKVI